jgi:hypothetical protein
VNFDAAFRDVVKSMVLITASLSRKQNSFDISSYLFTLLIKYQEIST